MTFFIGVSEVFETFQGEAHFTGTPSVFLRLQGCNVGCPWCDTKHTWEVNREDEVSAAAMLAKDADLPTHARLPVNRVVEIAAGYASRHVVITGGEPAYWPLWGLARALLDAGKSVQVETSGTEVIDVPDGVWVTLSPKIGMPGGKLVLPSAIARADEIKMPVGKPADIEKLDALLAEHPPVTRLIWLQPLSMSEKATALCMDVARERGWRVSVQTHKFLGVR